MALKTTKIQVLNIMETKDVQNIWLFLNFWINCNEMDEE